MSAHQQEGAADGGAAADMEVDHQEAWLRERAESSLGNHASTSAAAADGLQEHSRGRQQEPGAFPLL